MPKEATFEAGGEPLTVAIDCLPRADGEYTLKFWEKNKNKKLKQLEGNFVNDDDDVMKLGKPASTWDGRLVNYVATLAVPDGTPPVTVTLRVLQGLVEIQSDSAEFPPGSSGETAIIYIKLKSS